MPTHLASLPERDLLELVGLILDTNQGDALIQSPFGTLGDAYDRGKRKADEVLEHARSQICASRKVFLEADPDQSLIEMIKIVIPALGVEIGSPQQALGLCIAAYFLRVGISSICDE
jgi:hypothetical protein